jgi:isopentenyl diphosphate isomerase/L-lactate dehydrogenase-like FMN-dependent dehydrogenase
VVPQRDLATSIVGTPLSSPVLLAPIGAASVVAPNSDVIIARGAAAAGAGYVISCQGCNPLEETAATMSPWPFWYQLYWSTDEALVDSMISDRQIDNAIASLDALISIREAVGPQPTILLDSGIRSGTDVLIALALGANACLIGRPYVYGLAIAGADGVRQVIENIVAELDLTMGLLGIQTTKDLSRDLLIAANEDQMGAAAVK